MHQNLSFFLMPVVLFGRRTNFSLSFFTFSTQFPRLRTEEVKKCTGFVSTKIKDIPIIVKTKHGEKTEFPKTLGTHQSLCPNCTTMFPQNQEFVLGIQMSRNYHVRPPSSSRTFSDYHRIWQSPTPSFSLKNKTKIKFDNKSGLTRFWFFTQLFIKLRNKTHKKHKFVTSRKPLSLKDLKF